MEMIVDFEKRFKQKFLDFRYQLAKTIKSN